MSTQPPELDWADVNDPPPDDEPAPRPERTVELPAPTPHGDPACHAERDRVLRHPDIAKRLCDPPLRYSRPEVWNGYVPSETWQGRHNDSPQRAALLAIITDAVKADQEAAE